jgi:PAS domain-containing protein
LHQTLLESTQDLVAIFDERGNLLLHNRAFAKVYALASDSSLTLLQARARWIVSDESPPVLSGTVEEGEVSLDRELY